MIIAAAAAVGITVLFFVFLLGPKLGQISEVRDEVQSAEDLAATLRLQIQRLEDVRKDAPRTRARLARVNDLLPSDPQLPTFIRLLQDAALREGADLVSIAPQEPAPLPDANGVQVIGVNVVVNALFHPLENFLARVENLRRIVEVQSLAITPSAEVLSGGDALVLNAQISLQMYVVSDDASAGSSGGSKATVSTTSTEVPS
jgi:Tfp pilus assembly protein PilO